MLSTHKQKKKIQRKKEIKKGLIRRRRKLMENQKKDRNLRQILSEGELKSQPFHKPGTPEQEAAHREEIKKKLQRNLEVLKALDEEYNREMKDREEINKKLEEQGNITPQQKIEALNQEAQKITQESIQKIEQT